MVISLTTLAKFWVKTGLSCQDQLMGILITCSFNLNLYSLMCRFGPIFMDFSPKRVMYSGWVGDDDPTFKGLKSALKSYLMSAWAGESKLCINSS